MKIKYSEILNKNMINVFKDVLKEIETNGIQQGHHLYITFDTNNRKLKIPDWLREKHPKKMTIIIQYEYWNFKVQKNNFIIDLSFNNIKTNLNIPFESIISFADPYANFGLQLIQKENKDVLKNIKPKTLKSKKIKIIKNENNVIEFKKKN